MTCFNHEGVGYIARVDASKGGKSVITFINNLEKDSQYKRLPSSVKRLLQPAWSLHAIQRNLYTMIFIVDVLSLEGSSMLMQMQFLHEQQYPVFMTI